MGKFYTKFRSFYYQKTDNCCPTPLLSVCVAVAITHCTLLKMSPNINPFKYITVTVIVTNNVVRRRVRLAIRINAAAAIVVASAATNSISSIVVLVALVVRVVVLTAIWITTICAIVVVHALMSNNNSNNKAMHLTIKPASTAAPKV